MRETVMEVIERKDSSQRENNVTRHFSPRAQRGWADLLVLAGGSGRKQVTRVCQGSFVNPWATKEENLKSERVRYLAARIMWTATTSPDKVFSRAGRESWTFCTVHVNNALARKRNACKEVLVRFWREMISRRIDGIGGDFNMAADHTVDAALRVASNEVTQTGGSLQTVNWKKFKTCDDSAVYYQMSYNSVPTLRFWQSRRANRIAPQDVVSRLGDGDRYEPLLVTFRPASADVRAHVPEAPGEALHIARRRGHRQRGQPYERTILPVGLQSHPAEFPGASSATSSARFPGYFPPLVPRTARSG